MPNRVLLDADVPPAVADGLRQLGHDVVAASVDASLQVLEDSQLLQLTTQQSWILVTFNRADFVGLAITLFKAKRDHAGIILVHSRSYRRTEIGAIVRALDHLLRSSRDFTNRVLYLARDQS